MKTNRITQITIVLALIAAVSNYGVYTWPFRTLGDESFFYPPMIGTNILAVIFILSPILSAYFYLKKSNACYLWLGLFAIPAFMFSVVPIPFANLLYTDNPQINTIFIAIVNIALVTIAWFLYRANKAFNPTLKSGAV